MDMLCRFYLKILSLHILQFFGEVTLKMIPFPIKTKNPFVSYSYKIYFEITDQFA